MKLPDDALVFFGDRRNLYGSVPMLWGHAQDLCAHIQAQATALAERDARIAELDRDLTLAYETVSDKHCRAEAAEKTLADSSELLTIAHMDGYHKGQRSCTDHAISIKIGEHIIEKEVWKCRAESAKAALLKSQQEHRQDVRCMGEQVAELKRKLAWHPIKTAPKDGTHFLAWDGRENFDHSPPTVVHWFEDGFYTSVNELAPERPYTAKVWTVLLEQPAQAALAAGEVKP